MLHSAAATKGKFRLSKQNATETRDHLILSLCYFNCLRASNLMNITLEDVNKITKHEEIEDAWVLTNEEYKVSMIYSAKVILLYGILHEQLNLFIEIFCPVISDDTHLADCQRYLFTSSRLSTSKPPGTKMDQSAISNALSATFKKAKVGFSTPW